VNRLSRLTVDWRLEISSVRVCFQNRIEIGRQSLNRLPAGLLAVLNYFFKSFHSIVLVHDTNIAVSPCQIFQNEKLHNQEVESAIKMMCKVKAIIVHVNYSSFCAFH
jgi:hypothetical protein